MGNHASRAKQRRPNEATGNRTVEGTNQTVRGSMKVVDPCNVFLESARRDIRNYDAPPDPDAATAVPGLTSVPEWTMADPGPGRVVLKIDPLNDYEIRVELEPHSTAQGAGGVVVAGSLIEGSDAKKQDVMLKAPIIPRFNPHKILAKQMAFLRESVIHTDLLCHERDDSSSGRDIGVAAAKVANILTFGTVRGLPVFRPKPKPPASPAVAAAVAEVDGAADGGATTPPVTAPAPTMTTAPVTAPAPNAGTTMTTAPVTAAGTRTSVVPATHARARSDSRTLTASDTRTMTASPTPRVSRERARQRTPGPRVSRKRARPRPLDDRTPFMLIERATGNGNGYMKKYKKTWSDS